MAVGRACGTVEAFATSGVVCEAPLPASSPYGEGSFDTPLRSFQLPSAPVALALIGSDAARVHTRSLLCKAWLGSDVTPGTASLREALQPPAAGAEADPSCGASSRLLLAVGQRGHACVVEWEGSFATRLVEQSSEAHERVVALADSTVNEGPTDAPTHFMPIGKESQAAAPVLQQATEGIPFCCRAAYLLPGPVAAASNHPFCHSLLAFGGKENDAKVVDLDYGKILWMAKNVKPSFLGLRCEVAVTQLEWVLSLHPMVLAVGTAKGMLRFYDLRCQRRPVLEVCEATQEKRPVTALCVRPTVEVLQRQTDMRLALARAAESAACIPCCKLSAQPTEPKEVGHGRVISDRKEEPHGSPSHHEHAGEAKAAEELLAACSGKESATVYYADSYGMVYGLRVETGAALLRLADKASPKYNSSSYRSLGDLPKVDRPAEEQWRLVVSMLEKQRQRLSSKKNDHPLATAGCAALQLAAVPLGGFKGAMGAIVGKPQAVP